MAALLALMQVGLAAGWLWGVRRAGWAAPWVAFWSAVTVAASLALFARVVMLAATTTTPMPRWFPRLPGSHPEGGRWRRSR